MHSLSEAVTQWATTFGVGMGLMLARLVAIVVAGLWLTRSAFAQRRRVYQRDIPAATIRRELLNAFALCFLDAAVFVPVHGSGLIRFAPSTATSAVVTFALFFVGFEIAYYGMHRLLHTKWLYFIHRRHHEATVSHPFSGFAFSAGERMIQVTLGIGGVALASRVLPVSQVGFESYLVLSYVLHFLGHSNVEFAPAGFAKKWLGKVFITTTFHAMHHARFHGHYGLFTVVLDRMFGSQCDDYAALQQRAANGQGARTLGQRFEVENAVISQQVLALPAT